MYLTKISLNPRNPNARRDWKHAYEFHRTLRTSLNGELTDGDRQPKQRLLFFLDNDKGEALVQTETNLPFSAKLPEGYALRVQSKAFEPTFYKGQLLRFRLLANPTQCLKANGKRTPLWTKRKPEWTTEQRLKAEMDDRASWKTWIERKAEHGGFRVLDVQMQHDTLKAQQSEAKNRNETTHLSVLFEGVLEIVTPDTFIETLKQGIGASKGFGFGMMQLAPL
jgi:CRISPR system Cascade subunit CasE